MNTKPGTRKAKKPGKKKKDDPAVEHEDLDDDDEQQPHTQEIEDAAGLPPPLHAQQTQRHKQGYAIRQDYRDAPG